MAKIGNESTWDADRWNFAGILIVFIAASMILAGCDDDPEVEVQAAFSIDPEAPITRDEVTLDASESQIMNDGTAEYSWTLTPPDGSEAEISDPQAEQTTFEADVGGDYQIELTVTANGQSDVATEILEVMAEEEISSDITEDRTLTAEVLYRVTNPITVEANLTIEPGVRVEFEQGTSFMVESAGALEADGTEENPIILTGTEEQPG